MNNDRPGKNDPCPCSSGKKYRQCCWLKRFDADRLKPAPPTQQEPIEACPCGSGKSYKRCCYPRPFVDPTRFNCGIDSPILELAARRRAIARLRINPPKSNFTIATVEVGHTRVECAPIPPCGEDEATTGTLAPPTALQIERKYEAIRASNPGGVTEVVVCFTYNEEFGFAEARMVFDADERFVLVDGRVVSVLDLAPGMQIRMSDGSAGTITADPEFRSGIPVPPLEYESGSWSSRAVGSVKHTTYEVIEFRWAGQMVRVTPGHLVWSEDRQWWIRAYELLPGEMILVAGNTPAWVEDPGRLKTGPVEVYGIEVEYFHNYFVGTGPDAMLVHNGECIVKPERAESGKLASSSKVGMSSDPQFAAGYEAIFRTKAPVEHVRDPNWTHTWSLEKRTRNVDILTEEMGLGPITTDGRAAHHIVQATNNKHPSFQKARDLLLEHQIDINSSANGVALQSNKPGAKVNSGLRLHEGGDLHTNVGGQRTFARLDGAVKRAGSDWGARRQAILNELDLMRVEILAGTFP